MFRFKRNRSIESFQRRLLIEEEDKYISYRFNKALVRRLTQLDGAVLDSFMLAFRPLIFLQNLPVITNFNITSKRHYTALNMASGRQEC